MLVTYSVTITCGAPILGAPSEFKPWPAQVFAVKALNKNNAEEVALDLFLSVTPQASLGDFAVLPSAIKSEVDA